MAARERSQLHTPTTVTPSRRPASSRDLSRSPAREPHETTRPRHGPEPGRSRAAPPAKPPPPAKPQWSIRSAGRPAAPSRTPQCSSARRHSLADAEIDQLARELAARDAALGEAEAIAASLRAQLGAADAALTLTLTLALILTLTLTLALGSRPHQTRRRRSRRRCAPSWLPRRPRCAQRHLTLTLTPTLSRSLSLTLEVRAAAGESSLHREELRKVS